MIISGQTSDLQKEQVSEIEHISERHTTANENGAYVASEPDRSQWAGPDGPLGKAILEKNVARLESYKAEPTDVREHANHELDLARGGYADRQIVELTQNSADSSLAKGDGSIEVVLTANRLYFADNGRAIDEKGVTALLHTHLSDKRGDDQIGRFGLGFKSLLRVSNRIEFISRSCSFRFDRDWSSREIRSAVSGTPVEGTPMMRLALPFDPKPEIDNDSTLKRLAANHVNIIRVALSSDQAFRLSLQMVDFPSEFLLLIDHIGKVKLNNTTRSEISTLNVRRSDELLELDIDGKSSSWRRFRTEHELTGDAIADRRTTEESGTVVLTWVVPDHARGERGKFWAYFPTQVNSLVAGIVNAPWKTNEDRTNLLTGDFNDELIDAAATLIAANVGSLNSESDPARHLDALPPREESDYPDQAKSLRRGIFRRLNQSEIVPDRTGVLQHPSDIQYPPRVLLPAPTKSAIDLYTQSKYAPPNALHALATTQARWVRVEELNDQHGRRAADGGQGAVHPTVKSWLEALTSEKTGDIAVAASRDAVQVAALIDADDRPDISMLGRIVRTQSNEWRRLDEVYLPSESSARYGESERLVHDDLAKDESTLAALKALGAKELSKKERFRDVFDAYRRRNPDAYKADSDQCEDLWMEASNTAWEDVVDVVKQVPDYRSKLPVLVEDGTWKPLRDVIWPGKICGPDEAPEVCVDTFTHADANEDILDSLGVRSEPRGDFEITQEAGYRAYETRTFEAYQQRSHPSKQTPRRDKLQLLNPKSPGPLEVLPRLPDAPRARYTNVLLAFDSLFNQCTVRHKSQPQYKPHDYDNYSLDFVRQHGVVSNGTGGVVPLADAGAHPSALRELSNLPTWEKIKDAFDFGDPTFSSDHCEAIEPEDEELIIDVWPGLLGKVLVRDHTLAIVRCSGISVRGVLDPSRLHFDNGRRVFVVRSDDRQELESVNEALGLELTDDDITQVLQYEDGQLEARRKAVRQCTTDAERLLLAVGESNLRAGLPPTLVAYKERYGRVLSGIPLAESAIATYDSGTLKHYRHQLSDLNPPNRWAGGPQTIGFVRSLGFPEDWAGARSQPRDPFVEVDGPLLLKPLHDYQEHVADRIVGMLEPESTERRGMLSLPTGAGKTRVAVEGTVRAMAEHRSLRSVLWVADRDELCEQAVQSWIQVWRCFGEEGTQLRVSRMWESQPPPEENNQIHVIVASLQTLNAKLKTNASGYDFIRDVDLVVFDEAHRSIAPSFTNALREIGFTPRQGATEPFLMGLTATPYRGHNDAETRWLVNRYGRNRLDDGAFPKNVVDPQDVVEHLQRKGILARARHEEIEGGYFALSSEELTAVRNNHLLSRSAEDRIARDSTRTERIIDAYDEHVRSVEPDAPTIIFATSVEHAMTLAAELSEQGVVARAVSGGTDRGTRRRIVEEFRRKDGEIKVLVNYGVFREGFDAPLTKVIIVARPVWSPNLYFQMIGRGLRGPANGGNNECLIINIGDNIENYERKLAFTEVDWLWD